MTTTQNLHLPQWEKTDRLMMDDFNDAFSKIDAAVTASQAGRYVKLKGHTVSTTTQQVDLDVSDIDFTQYRDIHLYCSDAVGSRVVMIRLNGATSGYTEWSLSSGAGSSSSCLGMLGGRMLFFTPAPGAHVGCIFTTANGVNFNTRQAVAGTTWDELHTINLYRTSTNTIPAGTKIELFGMK